MFYSITKYTSIRIGINTGLAKINSLRLSLVG
jgi:hypothetical protein